ncbi:MAG: pimeloyl-CoA dehydrogenase large subunit [Rhodospirillales bacterium CG15_BIG_FIL_POST_REV_8_21_14_020_66_15]|nr:MAG: pimeloyl-CoA dehydrogenase large subunit [Rhodospirillales bacterium CG15_BIG_FIL_POST_REV_8_21_14_020_66_15]
MDLNLTPEEFAFRDEVRTFLRASIPPAIKRKVDLGLKLVKDDYVVWQRILHERGWIAPGWPKEYGGPGWSPVQRYLFEEELAAASSPRLITFGLKMLGPVLIEFGTEAQKQRFLPRILASEDWWCQGFSEPGAGSDLASLTTRADRDGDHYVVNGQKTWTTLAQYADWMFALVRTSNEGRKQQGISFLLIDMKTPGVTVRPIKTLDGGQEINDVFLENVKVPAENLVGRENDGWTVAKFLLGHERFGIAGVARSKKQMDRLRDIAARETKRGRPLIEDARFRERMAEIEIELTALEMTELRLLSDEAAGRKPGPEASILKLKGTQVQQGITELLLEAVGNRAHVFDPGILEDDWPGAANDGPAIPEYAATVASHYFNWRKASIYGGSNEIQRGIIAKAILGL